MTKYHCKLCYQPISVDDFTNDEVAHQVCDAKWHQRARDKRCVKCGVKSAVRLHYRCAGCTVKSVYWGYGPHEYKCKLCYLPIVEEDFIDAEPVHGGCHAKWCQRIASYECVKCGTRPKILHITCKSCTDRLPYTGYDGQHD